MPQFVSPLLRNSLVAPLLVGALIYRVVPPVDAGMKTKLKVVHAATMAVVFMLMVAALKVQYSTVQYSTVQYSAVQYSTVQYSTVRYGTVRYGTVQYSTIIPFFI